jgi:NAD-dependent DNA ligase
VKKRVRRLDPRRRAATLRAQIARHDRLYYQRDRPEISDATYDELVEELRSIERAHPELVTPDSPTQRVGGAPATGFQRVRHSAPMLSLHSTSDPQEVAHFHAQLRALSPNLISSCNPSWMAFRSSWYTSKAGSRAPQRAGTERMGRTLRRMCVCYGPYLRA